jgi:hypothetical protein
MDIGGVKSDPNLAVRHLPLGLYELVEGHDAHVLCICEGYLVQRTLYQVAEGGVRPFLDVILTREPDLNG